MMKLLGFVGYTIGTNLYVALVHLAGLWNHKARKMIEGRAATFASLANASAQWTGKSVIWFHCASLGEFEQARPIIEAFKEKHADWKIAITFFSPSGYEIRKNYAHADWVGYLPFDNATNAQKLIALLNPQKVFFVKYELWFYYLRQLGLKKIPTYLVSAHFRPTQLYFKWYGVFFRSMLQQFTHIFCQNEPSCVLLQKVAITRCSVSNDTRFDRVWNQAQSAISLPIIHQFKNNQPLLVAGSSYATEESYIEQILAQVPDWKIIIAPHHITETRLKQIEQTFSNFSIVRYSKFNELQEARILLIDNIGMLSSIYAYANAAFIGGGYGSGGLHNTLEPAAFGMPICFGPNHVHRFPEAEAMVSKGIAKIINQPNELQTLLTLSLQERERIALDCKLWVQSQTGATNKVLSALNL